MLIVVRHGQTSANARGLLLGRADPALDAIGREQAAAVATELAPLQLGTRIVASPLTRTRETAAIIAGESGIETELDERWIELDYGDLEGTPVADVPADTWRRWRADPTFVPAGGESLQSLGQRVSAACDELLRAAADRDVIVVTHVSPVKAAVVWALGVGDEVTWRTYVAPGSVTRIAPRPFGPVLSEFNVTPWSASGVGR
ncbi:MAG TPA: histidine phosphatase family protein [Acidimicrobiales bacterium]|nr:histidine phosphatase family protein [Acidimicrobiales bacterium]